MLYIHQCRGQKSTDHLILLRPLTELGDRLADTEPLWASYFCCMHLPSAGVMSTLMTMSSFLSRFTGFELRPSFLPSKPSYLLSYLPSQWGFFFFLMDGLWSTNWYCFVFYASIFPFLFCFVFLGQNEWGQRAPLASFWGNERGLHLVSGQTTQIGRYLFVRTKG